MNAGEGQPGWKMEERARSANRRNYGEWERRVERMDRAAGGGNGTEDGLRKRWNCWVSGDGKKTKREDRKMIMVCKNTIMYTRKR